MEDLQHIEFSAALVVYDVTKMYVYGFGFALGFSSGVTVLEWLGAKIKKG